MSISAPIGDPGKNRVEKTQNSAKIASGVVVCVESYVGPRTVIHSKVRIMQRPDQEGLA